MQNIDLKKVAKSLLSIPAVFVVFGAQTGLALAAGTPQACQKSVIFPDACIPEDFGGYLFLLISRVMPLILFVAVVMTAFSGIQYMLGGLSKDGTAKAKQRIIGSIIGVIFFLFITLIVKSISNGILVGG